MANYVYMYVILNIVKEYFKIVNLFIKSEEVVGNQVFLYKNTTGCLYFYIRFDFAAVFSISVLVALI